MSNTEYKLYRATIYEEAKSTMPIGLISMTLVGKCLASRLALRPRIAFIVYSMGLPTFPYKIAINGTFTSLGHNASKKGRA
jgi:hypothetical protein